MNPVRGVVMLIAACLAFYKGWQLHSGRYALLAYGLGILALALAAWHFAHLRSRPRLPRR